jgi:glycosyltransferase involved in cell wall biosynthesis
MAGTLLKRKPCINNYTINILMKKVLFICLHRANRSPGQRFRFEEYLSHLRGHGYDCHLSYLLSEKDDKGFYVKGNYTKKAFIYLKTLIKRTGDWFRMNKYDIIFIYRDALMTGSIFFEKRFARSRAKIIFDFDDSVWLDNVSEANKKLSFLKNAGKTGAIIKLSDMIFAGNQYLADYASQFNKNIVIVPTTIDTAVYLPVKKGADPQTICIGWSGSITTIQHFALAIPALKRVKDKMGSKVKFRIIGDATYYCKELETQGIAWKAATELEDLAEIDIGIMPLADDEWAKGKCGLKGLQYMALGIPTLMSPVGVNTEIIQHGVNGYLPASEDEWVDIISKLAEDKDCRTRIGAAGRQTVVEKYSVEAWKDKYLDYFNRLIEIK